MDNQKPLDEMIYMISLENKSFWEYNDPCECWDILHGCHEIYEYDDVLVNFYDGQFSPKTIVNKEQTVIMTLDELISFTDDVDQSLKNIKELIPYDQVDWSSKSIIEHNCSIACNLLHDLLESKLFDKKLMLKYKYVNGKMGFK